MTHAIATTAAPVSDHDAKLARQAERLVGQTFYGTLLKQMHDSPFKSKLMDGGRGGEAFQPLMDQHLIDHMSHTAGRKLVRTIVKHITRREKSQAVGAGAEAHAVAAGRASNGGSQPHGESRDSSSGRKSGYPKPSLQRNTNAADGETRSHVPPGLRA